MAQLVKHLPANAGDARDAGMIPASERSREDPWVGSKTWQPAPVFLPGKFHGQRNLVGYSSWGHKESVTHIYTHIYMYIFIYYIEFIYYIYNFCHIHI